MTTKHEIDALIDRNHKAIIARMTSVQDMFRFPQFDDKHITYALTSGVDGFIKQCVREVLFQQDLETVIRTVIAYRDNLMMNLESLTRKHLMSEKELSKVGMSREKIEYNIDEVKKLLEEVAEKEKQAYSMCYDMINRLSFLQETHVTEWKSFNTKVTNVIVDHLSIEHNIHLNTEERELIGRIKSPIQIKKALVSSGIDISPYQSQETHNLVLHQIRTAGALAENAKRIVKGAINHYFKDSIPDRPNMSEKELCAQILKELNIGSTSAKNKLIAICQELNQDPDQLKSILQSTVDGTRIQKQAHIMDTKGKDDISLTDKLIDASKDGADISMRQQKEFASFIDRNQPIIDKHFQNLDIKRINGLLNSQPNVDQTQANDHSVQPASFKK